MIVVVVVVVLHATTATIITSTKTITAVANVTVIYAFRFDGMGFDYWPFIFDGIQEGLLGENVASISKDGAEQGIL